MRRLNILMFLSLIAGAVQAQFINNGATVTIQPGATLRVETDFINNTGTVTNSGTLEVQGNFDNNATFTSTDPSTVRFIGTTDANVSTGGAVLRNVEMSKIGGDVILVDNSMSIAGTLNFNGDDTRIVTGAQSLVLATSADIAGVDPNEYVATTGMGRLIKSVSGNTTVNLEVGDLVNYTPVSSAVTGTTYTAATLGGRAINAIHPNKPAEADSYLSRYWVVSANGITGYSNNVTGTYISADDVVGTASRIKGASYLAPDWSFIGAATNGTSTVTGSTTNPTIDFTGMNALNKLNLTAYLSSPLSGSSMTNNLQVYDPPALSTLLPTVSPYGAPTTTYSSIGDVGGPAGSVTDWIKVEIRNASNPATILETKSLLLKTNGSIVDETGSIPFFKDHANPVRVALHHRNHIAVLSNSLTGAFEGKNESYNFSTSSTQAAKLDPGDTDQLVLKNGLYCMIPGDINGDLEVNGSDLTSVKANFSLGTSEVYTNTDLNLDGSVDGIDLTTEKISFIAAFFSTLINI